MKVPSSHIKRKKINPRWIISTIAMTFALSLIFSSAASSFYRIPLWLDVVILATLISIGIAFDIIGIAVTSASAVPFHSMSARRVYAASRALKLIKNAEKVSNFCNDVVGDISGIVSGAACSTLVTLIFTDGRNPVLFSGILTALVAGLTVGGKAAGKTVAISHCNQIVYIAALCIEFFCQMGIRKTKN